MKKLTILEQIKLNWDKQYVSVLKDEHKYRLCDGGMISKIYMESVELCVKMGDLRYEMDNEYDLSNLKIVDTIHITQLCGPGFKKGDKVRVKVGDCNDIALFNHYGGDKEMKANLANRNGGHYGTRKLTEIEPYFEETDTDHNIVIDYVDIDGVEVGFDGEGYMIMDGEKYLLEDIKKLKSIK